MLFKAGNVNNDEPSTKIKCKFKDKVPDKIHVFSIHSILFLKFSNDPSAVQFTNWYSDATSKSDTDMSINVDLTALVERYHKTQLETPS